MTPSLPFPPPPPGEFPARTAVAAALLMAASSLMHGIAVVEEIQSADATDGMDPADLYRALLDGPGVAASLRALAAVVDPELAGAEGEARRLVREFGDSESAFN